MPLPSDTVPRTSFTYAEAAELERLLRKVEADNGWMPTQETFEALGAARPLPATDLIILKKTEGVIKILLTVYDAGVTKFVGRWHIPGGYVLPNRTLEEDCQAIAKRELGIDVTFVRDVGSYKWTHEEHSQGQPVSILKQCRPTGRIEETEKSRFFPLDELPPDMIESQHQFIQQHLCELKQWQSEEE